MEIFRLSALLELATGIALLLVPGLFLALIFQVEPDQIGSALSRLCGVALVSLALATGAMAPDKVGSAATRGLIAYNLGVALLFCSLSYSEIGKGLLFWPVTALHALIGGWMVLSGIRRV